jgi:CDP-4-dehydro-6-deoxyglucose reductase
LKQFTISNKASGRSFAVNENEPVLTAALRQGVMLPYSCKNGTCASCKGQLLKGDIHYPLHPPMGLDEGEAEAGYALFCQAVPKSDLEISVREIAAVRDIPVRMMPARVIYKELISPSVVRLYLRLPKSQRLQFLAGQYIDILLQGGKRRSF